MKRRRPLSEEERQLWQSVAKTANPLKTRKPFSLSDHEPHGPEQFAAPRSNVKTPHNVDIATQVHGRAPWTTLPKAQPHSVAGAMRALNANEQKPLSKSPVDRNVYKKLARGKLSPEARLDLHGYTLSRAHPTLISFIGASHRRGHRLVLVITGKGQSHSQRPESERGLLRHYLASWLRSSHVSGFILDIVPAHISHGGQGAFYIYLRR